MMRRLIFEKHGEPLDFLKIEEVDVPEPEAGELLVRMLQRPINPYELAIINGIGGAELPQAQVPGFEGVGVVESKSANSLPFEKGQRVIPVPIDLPGTWQEYLVGRPTQFIAVPDQVSDSAAALILNPLTSLVILREILDIKEDQWVLNTAASTNVGQLLIQFSKIMKFQLINVVRNAAAERHVRALGAEHIINSSTDNLHSLALDITKGTGVYGVIDPVGGQTGSLAAKTLKMGDKMLLFSNMSGEPVSLESMDFIAKKLTVQGYTSMHWLSENSYAHKRACVNEIFKLISNGALKLKAEAEFALADFASAIRKSKESGKSGKVLLV